MSDSTTMRAVWAIAATRPAARNTSTQPAMSMRAAERLPISHRKIEAPSVSPAIEARKTMAAEAKALNTTPVSSSRTLGVS